MCFTVSAEQNPETDEVNHRDFDVQLRTAVVDTDSRKTCTYKALDPCCEIVRILCDRLQNVTIITDTTLNFEITRFDSRLHSPGEINKIKQTNANKIQNCNRSLLFSGGFKGVRNPPPPLA